MKDLTKGNPFKLILLFALPLVLSGVLQQCYNIADSIIAGKFAGTKALAAVGVSNPITQLFVGLGTGASMGCSVIISQIFGAKRMKDLKTAIYTALLSFLCLSLFLMLVGVIFSPAIVRLLNTPADIYEDAVVYLSIYMWGLPFLFLYNISNACFTALGDSKKPLYFLIFSTIFNIVLDLWFVAGLHLGVAGVAWATFIAQGSAAILALSLLLFRVNKIEGKTPLFSTATLKAMCRIGIPTMIQNAIVNVGNLFVSALANSYGSSFIAGYSAALKINGFITIMIVMVGNAVSTFAAQNIGAGQMERPTQGLRAGILINVCVVSAATLLIFLFGKDMVGVFVDSEASSEVFAAGVGYLRVVILGSYFFILLNNCCAVCRAAGYMIAFTSTTLVDLVVRVVSAYALNQALGSASLYWSVFLGWVVGAIMGTAFFLGGRWKKIKVIEE